MNMRNIFLLLCIILCIIPTLADEKSDSVASKELEEVVVMGDRAWIQDGVINVIPSKQEKKLSNSPETLLKSMHLPFVQVNEGRVTTLSGEPVSFYINGEQVNEIDLATFWPKDVTLVQYLENPKDPKYAGASYVINFKMHEYEAGGVTRFDGHQEIPNRGFYTAASKVQYKKWTYGVMFKGDYRRDHRSTMTGETKYKGIYYGDKFYDEITRNEKEASYSRRDDIDFALDARYITDKFQMRHTLSLGWNRNPGSGSHSTNLWSENLFDSESFSDYSESRSLSPQYRGIYFFPFSKRWTLHITTGYSYARNHSFTESRFGNAKPVENRIAEDVNTVNFRVAPTFQLSDKWSFNVPVSGSADWFSSSYSGSADTRQKQTRQKLSGSVKVWWHPLNSLYVVVQPGVTASLWQIGDIKESQIYPNVSAQIYWNPTRKFVVNAVYKLYDFTPSPSESNPVLVKLSDLVWTKGNPYLKGSKAWNTGLYITYLPLDELTMSMSAYYTRYNDLTYSRYTPAPAEYGGIIEETVNAKPLDDIYAELTFNSSLLNRKLNVSVTPGITYNHANEGGRENATAFKFRGSMDYTIGNCRLSISYHKNGKYFDSEGFAEYWKENSWNFDVTYGLKDLYMNFRIDNIFNNKQKSWKNYNSANYSYYSTRFDTGRTFIVNLTYTFGYGKKLNRNINIDGPSSTSSSIRSANK